MKNPVPLLGLRTTIHPVTDLVKAKSWYWGVATERAPLGNVPGLIENPHCPNTAA